MKRGFGGDESTNGAADADEIEAGLLPSSNSAPNGGPLNKTTMVGGAGVGSSLLAKHWFLIALALTITMARMDPWIGSDDGPLYPKWTVKYGAVMSIFFVSGLSIRSDQLQGAIKRVPMHLFVQGFTLGIVPICMKLFVVPALISAGLPTALAQGFMAVGCLPPPVSTAVILTKTVGGNEAAAIFNSALGSLLGILVTPIELIYFIDTPGSRSAVDPLGGDGGEESNKLALLVNVFLDLSVTVLVPIILGQICRPKLADLIDGWKSKLSAFSSFTLLLIIYTTFCNTFCPPAGCRADSIFASVINEKVVSRGGGEDMAIKEQGHHDPVDDLSTTAMVASMAMVIILQTVMMATVFSITNRYADKLRFSRSDIVAIIFCSVHKSLTLGVPVMKIVFENQPTLSVLTMPVLMYHPIQIVIGGLVAPALKSWMKKDKALPIPLPLLVATNANKHTSPTQARSQII